MTQEKLPVSQAADDEKASTFQYDDIGIDVADMWRKLACHGRDMAVATDFIDTPEHMQTAMEFAAMAEACAWRSMGEQDCYDVEHYVPRPLAPEAQHHD